MAEPVRGLLYWTSAAIMRNDSQLLATAFLERQSKRGDFAGLVDYELRNDGYRLVPRTVSTL
jgi:hypothetical protein